MPRDLPRYVSVRRAKGHTYLYFCWHDVFRRLPDDPNSEAFRIEYARAFASISPEREQPIISGSVRALMRDYESSPEWQDPAPKTQSDYARVLDHLRPIGDFQADNVRRPHVVRLRNKITTNRRTGGNQTEAWKETHPKSKAKPESMHQQAPVSSGNSRCAQGSLSYKLRLHRRLLPLRTLEAHMEMLRELRDKADQRGQTSAAIRAEKLRGQLQRYYVKQVGRATRAIPRA
jgi:hypothetical protein